MLVQFGNNWIQKIPLTAKLDSACGLVQFWLFSEFFSSNYFQIGQHVVLLHIQIFYATRAVVKIGEYPRIFPSIRPRDAFRPIARERKYLIDYKN